ncbi:ArsR/SmtB family transcription factor [Nonomuraea sp. LPB2021202275-12-8]|uniref:ArsR/SmtB family transcription factor n=1 Tax=Nonomuraea sp. LPB2021202275-12-8 TaxID=3120159 RepID=UPI00300DBB29
MSAKPVATTAVPAARTRQGSRRATHGPDQRLYRDDEDAVERHGQEPYQPNLVYPAPGVGTVWSHGIVPTTGALDALIGRTRARILVTLSAAATTSILARRLSMAPGAVSQHLKVLGESGLVTRRRSGREVFYERSQLGDTLCAAS